MAQTWNWQDLRDWRSQLLWVAIGALMLALLFQGNRGLWGADEGRFSNIALQMLESGDWLTPHRHPDHIEYVRPPMMYWAIAAAVAVFGHEEWALRLPSALAYFATTLLVFLLARRLCPKRAWLPPVLYATNLVPFLAANYLSADSLLCFFETLGVYAFVCMWQAGDANQARNWRRLMWVAFGMAFLTKGPWALLPLVSLALFRRYSGLKFQVSMIGFDGPFVFFMVSLPWFVWMLGRGASSGIAGSLVTGNQAWLAIRGSYLPLIESTQASLFEPLLVYGPILLSGLLPWGALGILLALTQYRVAVQSYFSKLRWRRFRQIHQESVFLVSWLLVPLLILFVVQVRLWLFVLPLLVPMTLGIGRALQFVSIKRWMALALVVWMMLMLAFKGYAPALENRYENLQTLDAREFSQAIQLHLPARGEVCELAFFESTPIYGLKFYTGCNLLRVAHTQPRDTSFDLRFDVPAGDSNRERKNALDASGMPALWLMETHYWEQFQQAATSSGFVITPLQAYRGYQLARLAPR
jgi:4-amino-4-deoxy-L-arabinose transferase-like glycosyltransferase